MKRKAADERDYGCAVPVQCLPAEREKADIEGF